MKPNFLKEFVGNDDYKGNYRVKFDHGDWIYIEKMYKGWKTI